VSEGFYRSSMGLKVGRLSSKIDEVDGEEAWELMYYGKGVQTSFYKVGRGHE
jgi:hypothetical protein